MLNNRTFSYTPTHMLCSFVDYFPLFFILCFVRFCSCFFLCSGNTHSFLLCCCLCFTCIAFNSSACVFVYLCVCAKWVYSVPEFRILFSTFSGLKSALSLYFCDAKLAIACLTSTICRSFHLCSSLIHSRFHFTYTFGMCVFICVWCCRFGFICDSIVYNTRSSSSKSHSILMGTCTHSVRVYVCTISHDCNNHQAINDDGNAAREEKKKKTYIWT